MFKTAIPVLHISDSVAAEEFYCSRLGFRREFTYRPDATEPDPCYMGVSRDDVKDAAATAFGSRSSGRKAQSGWTAYRRSRLGAEVLLRHDRQVHRPEHGDEPISLWMSLGTSSSCSGGTLPR